MSTISLDAKERQKHFILNENMWKVMFQLSWPAVIAMVFYGLNSLMDAFFVGRYIGDAAMAGVSMAYPLSQISTAFGSLIGVGAGSALSIALGANDRNTQRKAMGNVNMMTIVSTVAFMIFGLLLSKQLISVMGGTGEVLVQGNAYFRVTVFGSVFWIYGLAANMIIRAEGKMKTAAWMMGLGLGINILANYIFIVQLGMGVEGAAWGTNIGMFVYSILGWTYFARGKATFEAKVLSFRKDKAMIVNISRLGLASALMLIMNLVQSLVVFNALARFGTTADVAFYGVVYRLYQFLITPIFGLMRAVAPAIGINYGANQYERAIQSYKVFSVAALILTIPLWLITLIAPQSVLGLMITEQVITATQITFFRVFMAILPLMSFIYMAMTFFPAVDKGKPATIIGMARQFVFYVPVMLIVPRIFGVAGVYYGSFAIDAIIVIWTILMVNKEFRSLRKRAESIKAPKAA
ncbi:MAG: MATE family efflux transporter [Oscillospiraceae bacterium]|nr:MATE family efflux transporter [Oscillospiraceae bacterium]